MIEGLPPDSALRRGGSLWTLENELSAAGIEITQMWLAMLVAAWTEKGKSVPPIVPIEHPDRPSSITAAASRASSAEVAQRFAQRRRKGEP